MRNYFKVAILFFLSLRTPCKIVAYLLLGYFWLEKEEIMLIIKASLATAEVSAGGCG